jgi:HK97 family phage portal protein
MGLWDAVTRALALDPFRERTVVDPFTPAPDMDTQLAALRQWQMAARPWRVPSITEALGVPAIQRAVTLIANTAGSLAVQGFRNGALMEDPPRIVARPDPYATPRDFYRDSTYNMATRGEVVWWIASRDALEMPTALIVVPLSELSVEANTRNRLFPIYTWGLAKGTRYSAANPAGAFVHVTYLREPGTLRGVGPLQLAGAASSVSVEAQEWAANFYASGGYPSMLLKSELELSAAEAAVLKEAWIQTPPNMPKVLSGEGMEAKEFNANPQGAQMLEAREHQNGDAARMFGIPGRLMEYNTAGASLTYQNLTEVWNDFVRGCLAPNYLEPMEQALTDLLPRAQTARFYVEGLLRADVKTRYEVYTSGITSGVLSVEEAQRMEGLIPGSVEVAPVPFAPPSAVPASLPYERSASGQIRCTGQHTKRIGGIPRLMTCNRLLAERGPFVGTCPRCKAVYEAPRLESAPSDAEMLMRSLVASVAAIAARPEPAPAPAPVVTIEAGAVQVPVTVNTPDVTVQPAEVTVHPSDVNVTIAEGAVQVPVSVTSPDVKITNAENMTMDSTELAGAVAVEMEKLGEAVEEMLNRPVERTVERDKDGRPMRVTERKLRVVS